VVREVAENMYGLKSLLQMSKGERMVFFSFALALADQKIEEEISDSGKK